MSIPNFLQDGGDAGRLISRFDWSRTPIGGLSSWPQSLKTMVSFLLRTPVPMVLLWGEDGVMLYNDAYSVFAVARHPELLGSKVREGWPEVAAFNDNVMRVCLAGGTLAYKDQKLYLQRSGGASEAPEPVWMNLDYSPVLDESGRPAGVMAVVIETSEHVQAEQRRAEAELALRLERDRMRGVLEGMAESFLLLDHEFRVRAINAAGLGVDNRTREEIVGRTHWEVWPGTEESPLGRCYKTAMAQRTPAELQHLYRWEDGREAWFEMRAYPVEDGLAIFYRDVTERREAEARWRDERERLQLALDAGAIVGTWVWHVPTDRLTGDERFAATFDLDPALCQTGAPLEKVVASVHPQDRERVQAAIAQALEQGGAYRCEYRVRRPAGEDGYRWIEASGRVERTPDGSPQRFPGVLLDIEARRAAELELDQTAALLKTFTEAVPGVIYAKNRQGRMLVANQGTTDLIGKPPSFYIGKTDAEFLDDPSQAAIIMATDEKIMTSGQAQQVEEVVNLPDGRRAVWLSTKAPLRDGAGEVVGLIGASVDITARKDAEAALAASEERFRFALDAAGGIGTWDWDVTSDLVFTSARFAEIYGLDPVRAAAGLPVADYVAGVHPDDRARVERLISEAIATDGEYKAEYRVIGGQEARWVIARGRCLLDDDGRPSRFPGVIFDITDRKRIEAELRELNETLEHRIDAAVAELRLAEEALRQSQKMEAVGQLTGGIAHDFNNMLAVVIGSLDLLSRRMGVSDARAKRYVDAAGDAARRAALLTQRLLAFSRQQPLQPVPVDANTLVAGMTDLLEHSLGPDVRLEAVLAGSLWRTHADPNQLENVLLNLAVNARDAMPDGGRLTIETQNVDLDDRSATVQIGAPIGQYVLITVSDTGSGMDEKVMAKAFDPFFTTKEVGKGTGLGLSQVYGFVKQSGGHVKIASQVGVGTVVKIYLPRLVQARTEPARESDAASTKTAGALEVVLVVEDEAAVRQLSVDSLNELGYRVLEADGAAAALRLLELHPDVSLLFTDVVMPEINGAKLAEEVRRRRPDIKVLFTTGYTRNAVVHNGVLDDDVELLGKPFTIGQLAVKVRQVLDAPPPPQRAAAAMKPS